MSPFQAMFARCPRIPVDCTLRIPQINIDVKNLSPKSYAQSKVKELQEMYTQCAQNMLKCHKRNKKMYDKKCRGPREFQPGDKVLVLLMWHMKCEVETWYGENGDPAAISPLTSWALAPHA